MIDSFATVQVFERRLAADNEECIIFRIREYHGWVQHWISLTEAHDIYEQLGRLLAQNPPNKAVCADGQPQQEAQD